MKVIIIIMQPITIQFAVRVRIKGLNTLVRLSGLCLGGNLCQIIFFITYEGLLHNTLALDVDTVQEACIQQTRV